MTKEMWQLKKLSDMELRLRIAEINLETAENKDILERQRCQTILRQRATNFRVYIDVKEPIPC